MINLLTPTLAESDILVVVYENRTSKIFFGVKTFFRMNFDFKNGSKNKFKDKNEKS